MKVKTFIATALTALALPPLAGLLQSAAAASPDLPTFQLEIADGVLKPARIEVPAGQRIKIEVRNTGKSAAEFESVQLRKETVLAPGAQSFVVIAPLAPGQYKFFDDFHQATAQGVIVAK
ncbi:MAG: cupredoxin domain-containing protein [Janthinobacterium lividum]